jgi:dihydroorotate dehydrogenase (fumarate)
MDLTTRYLGLPLAHPFIVGASPLAATLDSARRLEDGGAAAIVLHSLFEEQVTMATRGEIRNRDPLEPEFAAALSAFPSSEQYPLTPDGYLEHIRRLKGALRIPVIASLNGTNRGEWMRWAKRIEEAGADALEVNVYDVISDGLRSAMSVENEFRNVVLELKLLLRIPVAMKLSPYFTAFGNLARRLDEAGADGLVLFNRFYQPDVDLNALTIGPNLQLSTSDELRLRLEWVALLHHRVKASLAVTGGVGSVNDGIKAVLVGADAVQMVSAVLRYGPGFVAVMRAGLQDFAERREFESVSAMKGRVSFAATDDPVAFQRAHYIRTLQSWTSLGPRAQEEITKTRAS